MTNYIFAVAIDAKVLDILDRLERDTQRISDYSFRDDITIKYFSMRNNNTVTIYSKVFVKGGKVTNVEPGIEVIRFEVFRETETRSSIKCFHDLEINHERLLYLYLARLYKAMGVEGEIEMTQIYEQIEKEFSAGKHGWRNDEKTESTMRDYGLIADSRIPAQVNIGNPEIELDDKTGWDRTLIEMWNKGYSRNEIAQRVHVSKDRVTNRVTELRNKFGHNIVPFNKDRKKQLIKS